jgi:hypothetical protein
MLLNEFLKENCTVQELRASDAEQKKETAELKTAAAPTRFEISKNGKDPCRDLVQ